MSNPKSKLTFRFDNFFGKVSTLMCTNFALYSTGANTPYRITARTMDFAADLMTQLKVIPRGKSFPELVLTPLTNPVKWTNQYGYVGMECGPEGVKQITDGLNEVGVSVGLLWLADSQYPTSESAKNPTIYNVCLGDWILGNFASVADLKSALQNVTVINIKERVPVRFVLHYVVSDNTGANLVIEFTNGQMQTYEPANGVMTNAPPYPYHLDNLSNYVNLSLTNNAQVWWGQEINGSGCLGMPGDYTAPSRFIKATMLQQSTQNYTPENQEQAIGLALRILQNFATPKGSVVEVNGGKLDYTQWGVVRDHKNLVYHFFTQFNNNTFAIDLSKINFQTVKPNGISIEQSNWMTDITANLKD